MYGIVWSLVAKPEHRAEVASFLIEDARWSLANESGTLRFDVYADQSDGNRIWCCEAYTDVAASEIHKGGEFFAKFFGDILPRCCEGGIQPSMRWPTSLEAQAPSA